ncbi:hypothetical protein Dimus_007673 [Dionaea muscipula]
MMVMAAMMMAANSDDGGEGGSEDSPVVRRLERGDLFEWPWINHENHDAAEWQRQRQITWFGEILNKSKIIIRRDLVVFVGVVRKSGSVRRCRFAHDVVVLSLLLLPTVAETNACKSVRPVCIGNTDGYISVRPMDVSKTDGCISVLLISIGLTDIHPSVLSIIPISLTDIQLQRKKMKTMEEYDNEDLVFQLDLCFLLFLMSHAR